MTVHVLCTVRKEELLPAATMVFPTLRTGFPTAEITVWWNGPLDNNSKERTAVYHAVAEALLHPRSIGGPHWWDFPTTHHAWIAHLIARESEPFWICDTDVCFWDDFEQFDFSSVSLAGRYTPQFRCRFVNGITLPRLHTCLLRIDPVKVKSSIAEYVKQFPDIYCSPKPTLTDLVFPRYTPHRLNSTRRTFFNDTCSLLYAAIGGQSFTEEQNKCFGHLQFGTLGDRVAEAYPGANILQSQFAAFEDTELLRDRWKSDQAWYAANAV